jgi:hypothetical protein
LNVTALLSEAEVSEKRGWLLFLTFVFFDYLFIQRQGWSTILGDSVQLAAVQQYCLRQSWSAVAQMDCFFLESDALFLLQSGWTLIWTLIYFSRLSGTQGRGAAGLFATQLAKFLTSRKKRRIEGHLNMVHVALCVTRLFSSIEDANELYVESERIVSSAL